MESLSRELVDLDYSFHFPQITLTPTGKSNVSTLFSEDFNLTCEEQSNDHVMHLQEEIKDIESRKLDAPISTSNSFSRSDLCLDIEYLVPQAFTTDDASGCLINSETLKVSYDVSYSARQPISIGDSTQSLPYSTNTNDLEIFQNQQRKYFQNSVQYSECEKSPASDETTQYLKELVERKFDYSLDQNCDVAWLISNLHKTERENIRMESCIAHLNARLDELRAVNARLGEDVVLTSRANSSSQPTTFDYTRQYLEHYFEQQRHQDLRFEQAPYFNTASLLGYLNDLRHENDQMKERANNIVASAIVRLGFPITLFADGSPSCATVGKAADPEADTEFKTSEINNISCYSAGEQTTPLYQEASTVYYDSNCTYSKGKPTSEDQEPQIETIVCDISYTSGVTEATPMDLDKQNTDDIRTGSNVENQSGYCHNSSDTGDAKERTSPDPKLSAPPFYFKKNIKGGLNLFVDGYSYTKHSFGKKINIWKCSWYNKLRCMVKVRIPCSGEEIAIVQGVHNHLKVRTS